VITTKAILGFDDETHWMKLLQTLPGETAASVQAETGFELLMDAVSAFNPPTETELRMIRGVIDPQGFFVKKPQKKHVLEQF
jgi:glutaconate CoA-transferase subunit B